MRCFVGLPIPEPLIGPLLAVQDEIDLGRAVPEDNLHLTLAFLDDQPPDALEALHERLEAGEWPAAELAVTGLVSFGGRRVKLVAAEVAKTAELDELQAGVTRAVAASGIARPRERFRPHITLVRFGAGLRPQDAPRLDLALRRNVALSLPPAPVPEMRLVGSTLTQDGARYDTMAAYPLG